MQVDSQLSVENYLCLKLQECQVESLVTLLSMVGCWFRQPSNFVKPLIAKLDGKLKNDLELLVRECLLPNLCALFDFDCDLYSTAFGKQPKAKPILKASMQQVFELFINLAL